MAMTPRPRYRWEVLVILLSPLACLMVVLIATGRPVGSSSDNLALLLPIGVLVLTEAATLREQAGSAHDQGLLSALLTGVAFTIPAIDKILLRYFQLPEAIETWMYFGGLTLLATGSALRLLAKRHLGRHFSHSIRLLDRHRLVVSGPYRYVRHPAYLGTLLIAVGLTLVFNSWSGLMPVVALAPLASMRMTAEEKLLISRFGSEYELYRARVGKLIPRRSMRLEKR